MAVVLHSVLLTDICACVCVCVCECECECECECMHVCVCVSQVLQNFRRFGERSTVMRATFEDALYHLPDASLDLVYLDGNAHTGQEGGRTIEEWFAKVAPGGMLAGHDYDRVNWPLTYHNVNVFANRKGLAVGVTEACGDGAPRWFVIAPD